MSDIAIKISLGISSYLSQGKIIIFLQNSPATIPFSPGYISKAYVQLYIFLLVHKVYNYLCYLNFFINAPQFFYKFGIHLRVNSAPLCNRTPHFIFFIRWNTSIFSKMFLYCFIFNHFLFILLQKIMTNPNPSFISPYFIGIELINIFSIDSSIHRPRATQLSNSSSIFCPSSGPNVPSNIINPP